MWHSCCSLILPQTFSQSGCGNRRAAAGGGGRRGGRRRRRPARPADPARCAGTAANAKERRQHRRPGPDRGRARRLARQCHRKILVMAGPARAGGAPPRPSDRQIWRQSDPLAALLSPAFAKDARLSQSAAAFRCQDSRINLSGKGHAVVTFRALQAAPSSGRRAACRAIRHRCRFGVRRRRRRFGRTAARHRHARRAGPAGRFRPLALRQSRRAEGRAHHLRLRRHASTA